MTIHARLTAAFAIMAIVMLMQSVVTLISNQHLEEEVERLASVQKSTELLAVLAVNGQKLRRYEKEYFMYVNDDAKREKYSNEWFAEHHAIRDGLAALKVDQIGDWSAADLEAVEGWKEGVNAYQRAFTRVDVQVSDGKITDALAANAAIQDGKNAFNVFLTGVSDMITAKELVAEEIAEQSRQEHGVLDALLLTLVIIGVMVAMGMAIYVPRTVSAPLRRLTKAANDMSKGKISEDLNIVGPPEIQDLAESMERLRVALRGILQRLQGTAGRTAARVTPLKSGGGTGTTPRL